MILLAGCSTETQPRERREAQAADEGDTAESAAEPEGFQATAADPDWYAGWDPVMKNKGIEYGELPDKLQTPKSIKATPMKKPGRVRLLDYWLKPTGWTTMWGHTLEKYENKRHRSDGVRWDTPTTWVPGLRSGYSSGGNMTLITQFGPDVPNYWAGAQPLQFQTDWIFNIDYKTGGIMEVFDRSHFGHKNGKVTSSYNEVVANGYYESLYWAPKHDYTVGKNQFQGKAKFWGMKGEIFWGYSSAEVINRYETFTVPPARNASKDCPAAEFKDVIALKHYQYWWDPATQTSRGDFMVLYMAKNVGWIHVMLNSAVTIDASGKPIDSDGFFLHMSPQGYVDQNNGYKRICAHEFRDMQLKKK
jgi:hypothetical protein